MSKNTLFNYFTKGTSGNLSPGTKSVESPKQSATAKRKLENGKNDSDSTPKKSGNGFLNKQTPASKKKKGEIVYKSDGEEETESPPEKKQKKVFDIDSEGDATEDEFKPEDYEESSEDESIHSVCSEGEPETASEEDGSPVKKTKKGRSQKTNGRGEKKKVTVTITPAKPKSQILQPSTPSTPSNREMNGVGGSEGNWPHLKYDFLQPNRIKDIKLKPASHPEYDPRTLHVPEDFKRNQTPAMRQWWEMKSKHYDCVIFFKVGKFYELYHMDAVTGANELNLLYMKGDFAHSGFPEVAYGKYSASLVERGYKVARVEQTETPDMMSERCKSMSKPTKFDKVVRREICQLTTKGTRVYTVQDGESIEPDASYLLALTEKEQEGGKSLYGVCFVDTSIAVFHLSQFLDDKHCSRLRTLFAHHPPAQILYERGQLTPRTQQLLNTSMATVLKEQLAPESEFWNSTKTLTVLSERKYFSDGTPEGLKQFLGDSDSLGLTAAEEADLSVRALGAITWYLSRCQLDHQLLSMGQFTAYKPMDSEVSSFKTASPANKITARNMILDSVTLKNLHVLENSCGGTIGTLLYKLDHCSTPMGKRLLHQWLCNPLTSIKSIVARQEAVTQLIGETELVQEVKSLMTKLPDLERLLTRIFAQSSLGQRSTHPDSRAIFFEEKTYSKKKIAEFISVLEGFHTAQKIAETFQKCNIGEQSEMLRQCSYFPKSTPSGQFPDLTDHLNFFKNAFNHEEASKEGHIIPSAGVDPEYDEVIESLKQNQAEQKAYLKKQSEFFGCTINYVGTDKKRFQLEIPEAACRRVSTADYHLQGSRKGFKRYITDETKAMLEQQITTEERKTNVLHGIRKRIFSRFSERYSDWMAAVQCLSVLDVLMSFAEYSRGQEVDVCVPELVSSDSCIQPFVVLKNGSYPCTTGDEVFIPNDTVIGSDSVMSPSLILVTGPNMGGKSTLMRQLGLIVIMAQMGCRVPAESLKLSPVDRIFTRIGANDDIMAGESTFYVELCETSAILAHATKHSLVLIDELGRGTSTYDGTAIANAVLKHLTTMHCRTLFSTHYHSLVEDFKDNDKVSLGHMACMAESEMEEDSEGVQENVTFLYKFAAGACPKSYGFNAARLAGVPAHITKLGYSRAKALETECNLRKTFRNIFRKDFNAEEFKKQITAL